MRSVLAQYSMVSGEITPQLYGRPDYQRHQTGMELARGWLPLRYGSLTRAPGTLVKGRTRNDAPARFISFKFAKNDTLTLELTDGIMRLWRYGSLVEVASVPYELVTPYDLAAIRRLKWAQVYDVIYLTDGEKPVHKLSRLALDDWTIAPVDFVGGPFETLNDDKDIEVQASAETGSITLTATGGDVFTSDDIGTVFYIKPVSQKTVGLWVGNQAVPNGTRMRYDGNTYQLISGGHTRANPPTHLEGEEKTDQLYSVIWKFINRGFGIVKITAVASGTSATAEVIETIPKGCIDDPTYKWARSAWSADRGYPRTAARSGRRLVLGGSKSQPRRLWFPELNSYDDHTPIGLADSAFSYDLDGSEGVSEILWIADGNGGLYVGSLGETFRAYSTNSGEVIGQLNIDFEPISSDGSEDLPPIMVDGRPIFIARGGERVFELRYDFQNDAIVPTELSLPAEHLGKGGFSGLAWQSTPSRHFWLIRGNGDLAAMVYDAREEVLGWCTVPVAGGIVEDQSVTYSPDGSIDVLTIVVQRTVDGEMRRYVEELAPVFGSLPGENSISEAEHFYCATTFTNPAGQNVFPLPHLEGEQVHIWTDVGRFDPQTVTGGQITLSQNVTRAHIGLFDATHLARTLDMRAQAADGSTLGRDKQERSFGLRLHATAALQTRVIAREFANKDKVEPWRSVGVLPVPSDLVNGYSGVTRVNQYSNKGKEIVQEFRPVEGAPATIVNIAPFMHSEAS